MFLGYDTNSEREMIKNFEKIQNGQISNIGSKKGGSNFKREGAQTSMGHT